MILFHTQSTGIHDTGEQVEWAVVRKSNGEIEMLRTGTAPIPATFFESEDAALFPADVLADLHKNLHGLITVSLPSSKLLMRVLELPSSDPEEIKNMVALQMDQISPFPADQLCFSYELLKETANHSRILAVATPRKGVDQLGDLFKAKNIFIRSVDAEILAWWSLLTAHTEVPKDGRVILILEEHTEFSMIIIDDGIPVCFHSLELFHQFADESVQHEILEEIRYTLLSLEPAYGYREISSIQFWSESDIPLHLITLLSNACSKTINSHDLGALPSLAEGLALRSIERSAQHVELVPHEWVEVQRRKRFIRVTAIASIAVLGLWLAGISIIGAVFAIRSASFNRLKEEAAKYSAPAMEAQAARDEMLSLKKYADHSRSALQCLLEITETLPDQVEISSFTYTKGKAVRLSGSGGNSDSIYDYFQKLGALEIFDGVENSRIIENSRFSITATLPHPETEERP